MSKTSKQNIDCPKCKTPNDFTLYNSANVTNDPELKTKILNRDLFLFTCKECAFKTMIEYPIMYHDMDNRLIVWLLRDFSMEEFIAQQSMWFASGYRVRVVENLHELIEKITIFDNNLKDTAIEYLKRSITLQALMQMRNILEIYFTGIEKHEGKDCLAFVLVEKDSVNGAYHPLDGVGTLFTDYPEDFRELRDEGRVLVNQKTATDWFNEKDK
ncbi:MAG: CpXC domain-containing protein [Firmicutes bacterium]|nr:CpXC domain-containing protein [Bacillota bacterium]